MKALIKYFLLPALILSCSTLCIAQQYTTRDRDEIAYQAQLTLNMYKDLLNVISYKGLASESEIQELIRNSYSPSNRQIFYSGTAIIEDNINPSNLQALHAQDKTVKEYLQYFDLAYEKSAAASIDFYNFEVSGLKFSDYLYIKVKYTCLFKGKHKEDPTPYTEVERLAELRVENRDNKWKTFITSIIYNSPENPMEQDKNSVALVEATPDANAFALLREETKKESASTVADNGEAGQFSEKKKARDSVFHYHLEAGEKALASDKLEEAFTAFSEAEKIYPFHQDLWHKLLELTRAQNRKINNEVNNFTLIKRNADMAYKARDYIKAKNLYAEALRLRPEEDQLKVNIEKLERIIRKKALLESKYAVGDYKEAIKDYTKAIKKDRNNPDFYHGRGKCYEELEDHKAALKDYTQAITLDGDFIEALSSRASLYTQMRQYHKAVADYTLIIAHPAYAADFYPQRARVKKLMGDVQGALDDYDAAIAGGYQVAEHLFEKGMILFREQKMDGAAKVFSEAIQEDVQHVGAISHRGLAYAALGKLQEASADFKKARELGLNDAQQAQIDKLTWHYYVKGEGAMEEKNYHRALESFKAALLISPHFGRAWLRAGDAFFMLEDYRNAGLNYNQAVVHDPVSFAYFKRALAYQQQGDELAAVADFKRFLPIGKELMARAGKGQKDKEKPHSLQSNLVEDRAEASYALGYAQLMTNQFVEALENLDMAIHTRKFYPEAYFARGAAFYALEDYKRAVKDMEESIKMGLSEPRVFYSLGKAYVARGQLKDAIYSFSHTIKLDPEHYAAFKERAVCYKNFGQYGLALEDIHEALSLNSSLKEDVTVLTHKGLLELHLNKPGDAKESFNLALRQDKNDGWALYGKACMLAKEQRLEESLKWYRKAFQTRQIDWPSIKNDPLISPISKEKSFKELVKTYL